MPITLQTVSRSQRDRILETAEGHFSDLKARDIKPAKLTRTVSAFANADGGELYIGISEEKTTGRRSWVGFADQESANGHVQALEGMFPLGQDFSYTFLASEDDPGLVLHVLVHKTRDIKAASDGIPYLRRGAQGLPVDLPEKRHRLELDKGVVSFESDTVPVPHDVISDSLAVIQFMHDVIPTSEPEPWLRKQQLVQGDKPTVAGLLLFADEPQAVLPKRCGIEI